MADDLAAADTLNETTRAERKWLLVSSTILVAISWGGLLPTKIQVGGLEVDGVSPCILVTLTWLVTAYFGAAFVFYYWSDRFVAIHRLDEFKARLFGDLPKTVDELIRQYEATRDLASAERPNDWAELDAKLTDLRSRASATFEHLNSAIASMVIARHRFEFYSALLVAGSSLLAALAWLLLRCLRFVLS